MIPRIFSVLLPLLSIMLNLSMPEQSEIKRPNWLGAKHVDATQQQTEMNSIAVTVIAANSHYPFKTLLSPRNASIFS